MQLNECKASKDDPMEFEWVFKAPEAELFNSAGKRIGRHYSGPTWEANDGSKVIGEVKARDNGPDPNAIPWLLLSAKWADLMVLLQPSVGVLVSFCFIQDSRDFLGECLRFSIMFHKKALDSQPGSPLYIGVALICCRKNCDRNILELLCLLDKLNQHKAIHPIHKKVSSD